MVHVFAALIRSQKKNLEDFYLHSGTLEPIRPMLPAGRYVSVGIMSHTRLRDRHIRSTLGQSMANPANRWRF